MGDVCVARQHLPIDWRMLTPDTFPLKRTLDTRCKWCSDDVLQAHWKFSQNCYDKNTVLPNHFSPSTVQFLILCSEKQYFKAWEDSSDLFVSGDGPTRVSPPSFRESNSGEKGQHTNTHRPRGPRVCHFTDNNSAVVTDRADRTTVITLKNNNRNGVHLNVSGEPDVTTLNQTESGSWNGCLLSTASETLTTVYDNGRNPDHNSLGCSYDWPSYGSTIRAWALTKFWRRWWVHLRLERPAFIEAARAADRRPNSECR